MRRDDDSGPVSKARRFGFIGGICAELVVVRERGTFSLRVKDS
jgi:hypothetical protein